MKKFIAVLCLVLAGSLVFAEFKNGSYSAKEKAPDSRGYIADIKITIKDGKIDKIEYNEAKAGKSKWADKAYNDTMKKVSGVSWADAVTAIEADLVKKQDVDKVDAVSGATELAERFKKLASEALKSAAK